MALSKEMTISLCTLGGAIVVAGVALLLNGPSSKELKFDIVCEKFITPVPLSLNLNQYPTELESVTADGFDGSLSSASVIRFARDQHDLAVVPTDTLTLQADSDPNHTRSYLKATRSGDIGKLRLEIGPHVESSN